MDELLNRRMTVALLALLPLLLLAWASLKFQPSAAAEVAPIDDPVLLAQLAALPARPGEAPPSSANDVFALPVADARAQNAAIPLIASQREVVSPFRFTGSSMDLGNARDCLALAALAEAGGSDPGQRAVIQVVLNRVRHPAFAGTVCGVVFEGSERATGCQFSFTCDGSLSRQYDPSAWAAARLRADQALKGYVFAPVGNATHYHTDWVFPYWSPKLVKIAQIETHLFFRWPGFWGSGRAWRKSYGGSEPSFAALMSRSPAVEPQPAFATLSGSVFVPVVMPPLPSDTPKVTGGEVVMRLPSGRANFVTVSAASGTDSAVSLARSLCTGGGSCQVMGWSDRAAIPAAFPLPRESRAALQFSYARDPAGSEIVLFNCDVYVGLPREKCIPRAR